LKIRKYSKYPLGLFALIAAICAVTVAAILIMSNAVSINQTVTGPPGFHFNQPAQPANVSIGVPADIDITGYTNTPLKDAQLLVVISSTNNVPSDLIGSAWFNTSVGNYPVTNWTMEYGQLHGIAYIGMLPAGEVVGTLEMTYMMAGSYDVTVQGQAGSD
jgi:hypothetical protein